MENFDDAERRRALKARPSREKDFKVVSSEISERLGVGFEYLAKSEAKQRSGR